MNVIINPAEGYPMIATYEEHKSQGSLGEDFKTPRYGDIRSATDGVVESVGGTYHEIVVRTPWGGRWRMAEVGEILVSKGATVSLGQVIGRNALNRGGIFRGLHLNWGGSTGRSQFTANVTHTLAQANAILHPVLAANQRVLSVAANARVGAPSTTAPIDRVVPKGTVLTIQDYRRDGGAVGGNTEWFHSADGFYFHTSLFTSNSKAGIPDATPVVIEPPIIIEPEPEPPVVIPEPPVEPQPEVPEKPSLLTVILNALLTLFKTLFGVK